MDLTQVISLLGALGVGSLGTAAFSQSKDRRAARATVVGALHETERCRWAGAGRPFEEAARELAVAALVARVPRWSITEYLALARTAAWESRESWDESGGHDEFAGGISTQLNEAVLSAFSIAVERVWRPWLGGIDSPRKRRSLAVEITALPDHVQSALARAKRGL